MDADILVLCDIYDLLLHHDSSDAVSVVKNEKRFEWPSLMVFSNDLCSNLTPEWLENPEHKPFDLSWAQSIGSLPAEYNHCVGYDAPRDDAKIVHYTQGIPCFPETEDSEYRDEWIDEMKATHATVPWREIMGKSVHEEPVMERYRKRLAA